MPSPAPNRADIQPVGGRRSLSLEIRGTILVLHERAWAGSATVFIPIEWVDLAHRQRRNTNSLAVCLLLMLVASLLLTPILAALTLPHTNATAWALPLLGVGAVAFAYASLVWLGAFLRPRPTTALSVSSDALEHHVEFWHQPGADPVLDALVERIEHLRGHIEDLAAFPVHTSHTWYRLRPLRVVVAKAFLISLCLYMPVSFLASRYHLPFLGLFLFAPPMYYLARYGLDHLLALREPKAFRAAVRWYNRGQPARAKALLNAVLGEHPRHIDALMLATYTDIELNDFPRAFEHCRALAKADPELADDFVREVWAIKRMHDRMNAAV
jgi:hypothetical protein